MGREVRIPQTGLVLDSKGGRSALIEWDRIACVILLKDDRLVASWDNTLGSTC